jgi:deaminated glutathione amidase
VAGPRGSVVEQLGREPGLLVVDLDLAAVAETRKVIPVLQG